MSHIVFNIGLLASQNRILAYFIIYLSTIIIGNLSAFASSWIAFGGYLGAWGVPTLILVVIMANLTGDMLWYSLGRGLRNTRPGNWIRNRLPGWHDRIERAFKTNGRKWIVLSKFVYATAFPVIFSAGWTQMPFRRFLKSSLTSVFIWMPILFGMAFGIFSGLSPLGTVSIFRDFEILLLVGICLFALADYLIARILGRAFREEAVDR